MGKTMNLAVVVGVGGGIGGALAQTMMQSGRYDGVVGVARRQPPDWPRNADSLFLAADVTHEEQIADAAATIQRSGHPSRVVVATGLLHCDGVSPEKTMRALDSQALAKLFALNAIAPALVAKHLLPVMPRDQISVFAALSARVGSISDNRLGGWYGYRASKAALNMLIATLAVEHRRTHPSGVCVALHPGTVETRLSAPFGQGAAAATRLTPRHSANALAQVMDRLGPKDSGGFFAWNGEPIPW